MNELLAVWRDDPDDEEEAYLAMACFCGPSSYFSSVGCAEQTGKSQGRLVALRGAPGLHPCPSPCRAPLTSEDGGATQGNPCSPWKPSLDALLPLPHRLLGHREQANLVEETAYDKNVHIPNNRGLVRGTSKRQSWTRLQSRLLLAFVCPISWWTAG